MKKPAKQSRVVHVTEEARYEFTRDELLRALRAAGLLPPELPQTNLTEHIDEVTHVFMQVPGGGDWSNTALDVAADRPLIVTIKREETR